jgi:hypothetical protein
MRNMLMPATVGLGIAVAACTSNQVNSLYMGPMPEDASQSQPETGRNDSPTSQPDLATVPDVLEADSSAPGKLDAHSPKDAAKDALAADHPSAPDVFMGQDASAIDGAGVDLGHASPMDAGRDLGQDAGQVIAKYVAPQPDAGPDGMPVLRYQAPMLDGSLVVPMYMAPSPT